MKLFCRLMPDSNKTRYSLVSRLESLGHKPIIDSDGAVILDWEGSCSGTPLAIITVFESFGCDRVFVFKDWGQNDEGQNQISTTSVKVNLETG